MTTVGLALYIISIDGTAVAAGLVDGPCDCAASLAKVGMTWCDTSISRPIPEQAMET